MINPIKQLLYFYFAIELLLFIGVGLLIGFFPTILLILITSGIGIFLLRKQQSDLFKKAQSQQAAFMFMNMSSKAPQTFAAILLFIPGFFTDILGVLCLVPAIRKKLVNLLFKTKLFGSMKPPKGRHPMNEDVIEGEFWEEDSKKIENNDKKS